MEKYIFKTDPVADEDATVTGSNYRFTAISNHVLRYEWAHDGVFEDRASTFAINRKFSERPKLRIVEKDDQLEIITPQFHLFYDKKRFSPNGLTVTLNQKVTLWGSEWRYGSEPERNLGGTARTLDGVDGRCDMGTGVLSRVGFSTIDDSDSMLFDGKGFVAPRRSGDRVDGYLFFYGHDFKGAMKAFYDVSGPQPTLPRWALGNWWSRYHKYTAKGYLELMDEFEERDIPLSVAVIDMDWHLVHDEGVPHTGWTGYTWDKSLFPDPSKFTAELRRRNLKITLNDHPHAGIHHHEDQYEEMALFLGHDTSKKTPILFDPTNPKFMEAFLSIVHRSLEKQGCDFWWIDWQQGPHSRVPGLDPLWLLNHFQFLDTEQTQGRSLIFSRYAGPGSHRYPVGFSGDSVISWASLAFQPEFTATASNIGYGWWSHDIGGHMDGCRDDELATRWAQFGVFSPIMRLHSSNSPWTSKEPWLFRPEACAAMTFFMGLRHRMVPYLHTMNTASAFKDQPVVRPMYWEYPATDEAYECPNQYYFGSSLLVSPIVQPRDKRTNHAGVKFWIPPSASRFVDIFTGTVYDADREIDLYRNLSTIPVLAPEGSIIPLDRTLVPENGCANPMTFEVLIVVGCDGHFTIIEDIKDDEGIQDDAFDSLERQRQFEINWDQAAGKLTVSPPAKSWEVGTHWIFRFISVSVHNPMSKVFAEDGSERAPDVHVEAKKNDQVFPGTVVTVSGPALARAKGSSLTVELGPDPQLSILDYKESISKLILDFQIQFGLKDKIWGVVNSSQPNHVKISRLLSLGLDQAILGPIVEHIVADSRQK
ncbi:hypothetical protein G7046_g1266 [Stylonectria norvegica]|nr:hypothetical protein G7046_g1266 [Stylonectria norvegica]